MDRRLKKEPHQQEHRTECALRLPSEFSDRLLWKLPQISRLVSLSTSALRNEIHAGRLEAMRFNGGEWRVRRDELERWIATAFVTHEPRKRQRPELINRFVEGRVR